ncbi:hypothetical protein CHS0354_004388 [Potamilus streckersoni]|uniref:Arrestin C-terminal-like domain-containing protein n=1 Tax=Potamilus streckersoni TaxID=2493646 RepID=A0AAE0W5H4_9BIVA|nr:hypothetical protein CHS0354_004388 [Potamilus streckersoni]
MGKLNIFEITLSNPQGIYFAGQSLQGHVTVELNDGMKMRGVRLKFHGRADVHWTETESTGTGDDTRTETYTYSATETYFNFETLLFGPGNDTTDLQAGRHTFPFVFQLPTNLPSSYESSIGYIRYYLKGIIDKPWKFDHTTKKVFTIIGVLDLNQEPTATMPQQGHEQKYLCCLCCRTGPISAHFQIDRRGYVPGDSIILNAEISNNSNRTMSASRVRLIMVARYHATTKSMRVTTEVARVQHGEIAPFGSDTWSSDRMAIPPLPPSYLAGCKIIDIVYILQFEVDPTGPSFDLEIPLEIIIGTIPLRSAVPPQFLSQYPPPSTMPLPPAGFDAPFYTKGIATNEPTTPPMPTSTLPYLPPPSYAECVFGKVSTKGDDDNEYTMGDKDFAPVYTYYDWSKSSI